MGYMLSTEKLTKLYGNKIAVNEVSLHVRRGDIYGLIGQNGAGKTSLLKMLAGLSYPSEGSISFFGYRDKDIHYIMRRIGILIEDPGLFKSLSAKENVMMKCKAMGIRKKDYALQLLKTVGLQDYADKKVKKLSVGMKQRLAIAMALVGEPDLIILDEPIKGLDPQGISDIRDLIVKINRENDITFIITSHILEELSKIATTFGIMHNGSLIQEMSKEQLHNACTQYIEIKTSDNARACTVIDALSITSYKVVDSETIRIYECLNDCGRIAAAIEKQDISVTSINLHSTTLEDIYFGIMECKKC